MASVKMSNKEQINIPIARYDKPIYDVSHNSMMNTYDS